MSEAEFVTIEVPRAEILRVSRRILGHPEADLLHWNVLRMPHASIIDTTGGLYLVSGTSHDSGREVQWSCVLKVLQRPEDWEESLIPGSWCYWRREAEFYGSGLSAVLPSPLRAPDHFGVFEPNDHQVWLWLEFVAGEVVDRWSPDDYHRVAAASGRAAAAHLEGWLIPTAPWLGSPFLRSALNPGGFWSTFMEPQNPEGAWSSELVAQTFDDETRASVMGLWQERDELLDVLDRVPPVFSHNDFHRRNLLLPRDPDQAPVAVDWAFCGPGSLGGDLAQLVVVTMYLTDVPVEEAAVLHQSAIHGYLEGLAEGGWTGDQRLVRLGLAAWAALWMGATLPGWIALMLEDPAEGEVEAIYGHTAAEVLSQWVALDAFALDLADEARVLARTVL